MVQGGGNGTPLQYSHLENPMGGGAWWAAVHGVAKSLTTERPHFHFSLSCIGEGNGNPLQCSCLENPRDGGAWWAAVYGAAQSWTRLKRLSSSSSGSKGVENKTQNQWVFNTTQYRLLKKQLPIEMRSQTFWGFPWWLRGQRICL